MIPAKNEQQMIGQCLDAINNLAYDPARYECIVVDNGSVDDTAKIAKQKGAKVLTLAEGTISALRNCGAKQAQGEYLAFIDADCVIDRELVETCFAPLRRSGGWLCRVSSGYSGEIYLGAENLESADSGATLRRRSRLAAVDEHASEERSLRGDAADSTNRWSPARTWIFATG